MKADARLDGKADDAPSAAPKTTKTNGTKTNGIKKEKATPKKRKADNDEHLDCVSDDGGCGKKLKVEVEDGATA